MLRPEEYPDVPVGIPVVETVELPDGRAQLVERCPFCGGSHIHAIDPGVVLSHCTGRRQGSYYLASYRRMDWGEYDQLRLR